MEGHSAASPADPAERIPPPEQPGPGWPGAPPARQVQRGAVPRWPTDIYYNVATGAEEIDEYETLCDSPTCVTSSVTTCNPAGTAYTISQIDDDAVNDDTGMSAHLMNNDPRPTYFHQSNLMGGSSALFYSVMNELLSEYNSYFSVPIEQPTMVQQAQLLAEQSAWAANTSVSGYIQRNQVTIANAGSATSVPLTGVAGVGSAYGGTQSGWTTASSGTSTYTAQIAWPAARTLTVQLSPARIVADGTSQSTATVTVASSDGLPIVGESLAVTSTDPGQQISAVTDNGNGTYTATITSSTTTGSATIISTDTALPPFTFTGSATLMQTGGQATTMTVQLSPSSIVVNGTSKSTATATLKDAQGRADIGDRVGFTSSDAAEKIGAVTDTGNGTYTAPITSSRSATTASTRDQPDLPRRPDLLRWECRSHRNGSRTQGDRARHKSFPHRP